MNLYLDFETACELDLEDVGMDRYLNHPSLKVLLLAYAIDDGEVQIWEPHKGLIPVTLGDDLANPFITKLAFNAGFERGVFKKLFWNIPLKEWTDIMVLARYASIPGPLEAVCAACKLDENLSKLKDGDRLINIFCMPVVEARETLFGSESAIYRNWETDPEDWELFKQYCIRDVEAERAIYKKLSRFPLPEAEKAGWRLDQEINQRGVPVDEILVANTLRLAESAKADLILLMRGLTGLVNPNSTKKMLSWAKREGYPYNSMGKVWVQRALEGTTLSEDCRAVLKMRQQASKTSWAKLEAIQSILSDDGTVKNQFAFLGSPRAGRWAGRDVQMQNLPKAIKKLEPHIDYLVELLREGNYEGALKVHPNAMEIVSAVIRSVFRAPDGLLSLIHI